MMVLTSIIQGASLVQDIVLQCTKTHPNTVNFRIRYEKYKQNT